MEGPAIRQLVEGARYLITNDYEWELLLQKTGWTESQVAERAEVRSPHSASTVRSWSAATASSSRSAWSGDRQGSTPGVGDGFARVPGWDRERVVNGAGRSWVRWWP